MILEFLKELIASTDPLVLVAILTIYLVLVKKVALISKDVERVDKAVNCREQGEKTISEEVSEINTTVSKLYTKIELQAADLDHVKQQIRQHREEDEKVFTELAEDIHILAQKSLPKRRAKKS